MKMKLMDDRVLVKPEEAKKMSAGGIILPGAEDKPTQRGEIIALGDDPELTAKLKVGMKVMFAPFAGEQITIEEVKYVLFRREDILAYFEE